MTVNDLMTKEAASPLSALTGLLASVKPAAKQVGNFATNKQNWGLSNYQKLLGASKKLNTATIDDSDTYAKWMLNRLQKAKAPALGTAALHTGTAGASFGIGDLIGRAVSKANGGAQKSLDSLGDEYGIRSIEDFGDNVSKFKGQLDGISSDEGKQNALLEMLQRLTSNVKSSM